MAGSYSGKTVVLANEHPALRRGLSDLLSGEFSGLNIIECNGRAELDGVISVVRPDYILMDRGQEGEGMRHLPVLRKAGYRGDVGIYGTSSDVSVRETVGRAGADYFVKGMEEDNLLKALRKSLSD